MGNGPAVVTSVALGAVAVDRNEELQDAEREIEELKQQLDEARLGVVPAPIDMDDEDMKVRAIYLIISWLT